MLVTMCATFFMGTSNVSGYKPTVDASGMSGHLAIF